MALKQWAIDACLDQGLAYDIRAERCVPKPPSGGVRFKEPTVATRVMRRSGVAVAPAPLAIDTRSLGYTMPMDTFGFGGGGNAGVTGPVGGGGNGFWDSVIDAGKEVITDWIGDHLGGGGGGSGAETFVPQTKCQAGTIRVGDRCVSPGDAFPGGDPFIVPAGGTPVASNGSGMAGMLGARTPAVVGSVNGSPIRRCPRSWVLGIDDLCYHRRVLPKQFRKWKPTGRAKISAHDWRQMKRYGAGGAKQEKAAEFAKAAGWFVAKSRPKPSCGKKKK